MQQAPAHGRDGQIDRPEQRTVGRAAAQVEDDLQVAERYRVQDQVILIGAEAGQRNVGQGASADRAQVLEHHPGSGHGGRMAVQPQSFDAGQIELAFQHRRAVRPR